MQVESCSQSDYCWQSPAMLTLQRSASFSIPDMLLEHPVPKAPNDPKTPKTSLKTRPRAEYTTRLRTNTESKQKVSVESLRDSLARFERLNNKSSPRQDAGKFLY